ncbi:MAG TPA: EamA family transporter, partial [Gemmatimonadales bacterium]|nr:EamA family transporter [Gemmatimonadales bacterium]
RHASATVVGTYAYVNPVVAVLLGWLVLGEAITMRTLGAMVLILGAVLMIQLAPGAHGKSGPPPVPTATALRRRQAAA